MKTGLIRKSVSFVLCVLILLTAIPLTASATNDLFAGDDYNMKLTSPDMQMFREGNEHMNWSGSYGLDGYVDQTKTCLAKNEKEGFQVFFYEKGDGRDIRLEIGEYVNANGDILPHAIYKEIYFGGMIGVGDRHFAEPLVPYDGTTTHLDNGESVVYYVELQSAADQPAGEYVSHFTIYDGNEVVRTAEITAEVWNFVLPEAHYSTTFMGLYNASSGYGSTCGFLEQSGVRFVGEGKNKEIVPEDIPKAERILEGWQDFLLDHGVTTYEIPRFLVDIDAKAAELRLADPRRHAFTVPQIIDGSTNLISQDGMAVIQAYHDLYADNPFLKDKALFYATDEVDPSQQGTSLAENRLAQIKSIWQDPHVMTPVISVNETNVPLLKTYSDILCVNQALSRVNQFYYDTLTDNSWFRTWRYSSNDHSGCFATSVAGKTPMGNYIKVFYWQQEALHSDGMLNWNCAYLPYVNGTPYDVWAENTLQSVAGVNGEGIFVYESNSLGLDPATPIASIRLKHINDGMDDYDYLQLAKEKFGTGPDSPYTRAMNTVFQYYTSKGAKYIFSSERSMWSDGGNYEFVGHDNRPFTNARALLGNALSEAGGVTHDFGPWVTAVEPDAAHDGMQIRTCADCGTQESQRFAASHTHDFGEWTVTEATCTEAGEKTRTCATCGEVETETIPALGHDWQLQMILSTYQTVCSRCGKMKEPTVVIPFDPDNMVDASVAFKRKHFDHFNVEDKEIMERTCTENGWILLYCAQCDEELLVEEAALGHDFGEWTVTEATCTEAGERTRTCVVCGEVETETIPALGHNWELTECITAPNCTDEGEGIFTCSRCGRTAQQWIPTDPDAHDWGGIETEATCTQGGYTEYICMFCGATCIGDETPALGHAYGDWFVTTPATTEANGTETRTCTRCGETETRAIDKLPAPAKFSVIGGRARPGETVQVSVDLSDNPGIVAAMLHLTYDPQILTLTAVDNGDVFGTDVFQPGGDIAAVPYTVFWQDALALEDNTAKGTLVTFTFAVASDAPLGATPVTVTYEQESTFNQQLQDAEFAVENGSVTVFDRMPGDADGDGALDLQDVAVLIRYLAGGWGVDADVRNSDVNGDGKLTLKDVVLLRRYLAGWDVELI